ncbi:Na+/H+ exchanger family protein [Apiospora saccharicola]|uniref:Na+/H+ exchanger family protein n=1 Tax=Apiospora saccharicola TaxID=335842 RepID=A0ABR1UN76_9PEZI
MAGGFLQYHEPGIVSILILISFFTFLWLSSKISGKLIHASIVGPIVTGIIYGPPLANILHSEWQDTFLYLGFIGLILIIFEGGLTVRLDLLRANFTVSLVGAAIGVTLPIAFSYLLCFLGFGYGAVETFILGAALSTTSLGTTFAVMAGAADAVNLSQTKIGAVLVSAAVIDDVTGGGGGVSLGWLVGRPIVASAAMAVLTPLLGKFVFAPAFRGLVEHHFAKFDHYSNIGLMILVLCAFLAIASYAGTSILFGAFLAGAFLSYLPSKHPTGPFVVLSREEGEREKDKSPTFVHTFEYYCLDFQQYVLEPLFFASIGFAIPFLSLWQGQAIWHGVVYTLLMLVAKALVGTVVPAHDWLRALHARRRRPEGEGPSATGPCKADPAAERGAAQSRLVPASLLGMAMVARGEIGLLIIEIGYNNTSYVSKAAFLTGVWAILLNTIIGPVAVGIIVKYKGKALAAGSWGLVEAPSVAGETDDSREMSMAPDREHV